MVQAVTSYFSLTDAVISGGYGKDVTLFRKSQITGLPQESKISEETVETPKTGLRTVNNTET